MSEIYRASFSLEFTDEKLYNELILPLKQKKQLKHLVMGLLEKYFYDEEFYNMAEESIGVTEDSIVHNYDDYFKDISAYVAILGSMQDTMEENVKEGLQNILDTAEGRDNIDEEVWGRGIPRISENIPKIQEESVKVDDSKIQKLESQVETLTNLVTSLMNGGFVQPVVQQVIPQQQVVPIVQQPVTQTVAQPQQSAILQTNTVLSSKTNDENIQIDNIETTPNVSVEDEVDNSVKNTLVEEPEIQFNSSDDDNYNIVFTDEGETEKSEEESKGDAKQKLGKLVASLGK